MRLVCASQALATAPAISKEGFTLIGASLDGIVLDPAEAVEAIKHYTQPTHLMLVSQLQANSMALTGSLTTAQQQLAAALEMHAAGEGSEEGDSAESAAEGGEDV